MASRSAAAAAATVSPVISVTVTRNAGTISLDGPIKIRYTASFFCDRPVGVRVILELGVGSLRGPYGFARPGHCGYSGRCGTRRGDDRGIVFRAPRPRETRKRAETTVASFRAIAGRRVFRVKIAFTIVF